MIELDEAWSFVWRRRDKRWPEQRCTTGPQVVAFVCGGRGGDACRALGSGCRGLTASATASATSGRPYVAVLPEETHRSVGKGDRGDCAHGALVQNPVPVHCALRPRGPSFFKKNWWHETGWTHWFIVEYNLSCSE